MSAPDPSPRPPAADARGQRFALTGWRTEEGRAVFGFEDDRHGAFEEVVWFEDAPVPDAPDARLSRLLDLVHVALGVSTYKLSAARRLDLPALTPAGQAFARRLYTDGLAEFFVRADLPYPPGTRIAFAGTEEPSGAAPHPGGGASLVAFGGGKDSYVARALVAAAGETPRLASVVMADTVRDVLAATAPEPVTFLRRSLDRRMLAGDLSEPVFTGHVPITAINTMVLTLYGRLTGTRAVVFANERSADEPTMSAGGIAANHQDSKGSVMEGLMADAVREADPSAPAPFSVLRPYSEVWIARAFAGLGPEPRARFTSCNRNFRLAGDAARRWCGACAKCAFTSLVMSPFLTEEEHLAAFGARFLDAEALMAFDAELLGLTETKPWDCVGTIAECRAALWQLSRHEAWSRSEAVRRFLPAVLETTSEAALASAWDEALAPAPAPNTPERYTEAARAWR